MASKNILLGSGKVEEEAKPVSNVVGTALKTPVFMYSKYCLQGVVVRTKEKLAELTKLGWKDHPGKVALLPGHEKLFEGEEKKKVKKEKTIEELDAELDDEPDKASKIEPSVK